MKDKSKWLAIDKASQKVDWTTLYSLNQPLRTPSCEMDDDVAKMTGPVLFKYGIDVTTTPVKRFDVVSKSPMNDKERAGNKLWQGAGYAPTLKATYMPNAIIVQSDFRTLDTNLANRLPISELMARGAIEAQIMPKVVVQNVIMNAQTLQFIFEAFAADPNVNGGNSERTTVLPGKGSPTNRFFEILLGSDNGRCAQQMLNAYPSYFQGKTVTKIEAGELGGLCSLFSIIS